MPYHEWFENLPRHAQDEGARIINDENSSLDDVLDWAERSGIDPREIGDRFLMAKLAMGKELTEDEKDRIRYAFGDGESGEKALNDFLETGYRAREAMKTYKPSK